jgi:hypothetical protein
LETLQSHDYFQYDCPAYHCIAAFNGVIEPQQDGSLHWHIMLYSSVLTPEMLEKAAAASSMALQTQIGKMLDSITCTSVQCEINVISIGIEKSLMPGMHGHGFCCEKGEKRISVQMRTSYMEHLFSSGYTIQI